MEEEILKNKLPSGIIITKSLQNGKDYFHVNYSSEEMIVGVDGNLIPKFSFGSGNEKLKDALANVLSNLKSNNLGYDEVTKTFK